MMDFVCFSVNNWEKRKARKQQFMLYLSQREDVGRVMYIEPGLNFWRLVFLPYLELKDPENRLCWKRALFSEVKSLSDKLFLFTPVFFIPFAFRFQVFYDINLYFSLLCLRKKLKKLGFKRSVLWLYHPFDYKLLCWFKERAAAVFDWAEDWQEYFLELSESRRSQLARLEEKMIKDADIVFTVSQRLLDRAKKINQNSFRLIDGTAPELFTGAGQEIPSDMKAIRKPILGYLGTTSKRVDAELLKFTAKSLPQASIVMIGNVFEQEIDLPALKKAGNIYFLGPKNYQDLGRYAKYFDVCILPYRRELSLNITPTKIYDYLATGKPVVSTDLPEMAAFCDYIKIAGDKEQFLEAIKDCLEHNSKEQAARRLDLARKNSWAHRAGEIIGFINENTSC